MNPIIPYGTTAYNTETIGDIEIGSHQVPCSFILDLDDALTYSATDKIDVYHIGKDGSRKTTVLDSAGAAFVFSSTNKHMAVLSPGKYRFVKGVTIAMGLNMHW
jgi:hypothetical protein